MTFREGGQGGGNFVSENQGNARGEYNSNANDFSCSACEISGICIETISLFGKDICM